MDEDLNLVGSHCPVCGTEYRPGFDTCADDGASLVPGPAPPDGPWNRPPDEREDPVVEGVAIASRPRDAALLLAGRLRAEGIPAGIDAKGALFPFYPYDGQSQPIVDVVVPDRHVGEARRLLDRLSAE